MLHRTTLTADGSSVGLSHTTGTNALTVSTCVWCAMDWLYLLAICRRLTSQRACCVYPCREMKAAEGAPAPASQATMVSLACARVSCHVAFDLSCCGRRGRTLQRL